jgi:flagellar biosynthesis/type III secretory pathway chaperone
VRRPTAPAGAAGALPGSARDTLNRLLRILQDEGRALAHGDVDALARSVREKEEALQRLAIEPGLGDAALRQLVRRVRDQNESNARLLAPRLIMNRTRLETLFGAARAGALYQPDGRAGQPQQLSGARFVRA